MPHGSTARLYVNGYDVSPYMREGSIEANSDVAESSTWGMTSKRYTASERTDGSFTGSGVWEYDPTGAAPRIDEILASIYGAAGQVGLFLPAGDAFGARGRLISGINSNAGLTSPDEDVSGFSLDLSADRGMGIRGRVLLPLSGSASIVAGGNSAGLDDLGAAATTTRGGMGVIHVVRKGGAAGTFSGKVQHSADNAVWTDLVTFAGQTAAPSAQMVELANTVTVQRWLRALWTLTGGSWDVSVSFSRV